MPVAGADNAVAQEEPRLGIVRGFLDQPPGQLDRQGGIAQFVSGTHHREPAQAGSGVRVAAGLDRLAEHIPGAACVGPGSRFAAVSRKLLVLPGQRGRERPVSGGDTGDIGTVVRRSLRTRSSATAAASAWARCLSRNEARVLRSPRRCARRMGSRGLPRKASCWISTACVSSRLRLGNLAAVGQERAQLRPVERELGPILCAIRGLGSQALLDLLGLAQARLGVAQAAAILKDYPQVVQDIAPALAGLELNARRRGQRVQELDSPAI